MLEISQADPKIRLPALHPESMFTHTQTELNVPGVQTTNVATKLVKILNSKYELSSLLGNKITLDETGRSEGV